MRAACGRPPRSRRCARGPYTGHPYRRPGAVFGASAGDGTFEPSRIGAVGGEWPLSTSNHLAARSLGAIPQQPPRPDRLRLVAPGVETFFGWTAGAAATLLGLLFVAVQVGFGRVNYDPGNRLHATARSTFSLFVTVFVVSLLFLYPGLDRRGLSIVHSHHGRLRSLQRDTMLAAGM